jgi:UDP-N-acetyl-D-glucosamine/UDP-N-acetyl-D-galactosamine dehydrogenase
MSKALFSQTTDRKIAVVGLGYVGLTIALAFGRKSKIVGFDTNLDRIAELMDAYDRNQEFSREEIIQSKIHYTTNHTDLDEADFYIVAVPTPLDEAFHPNLSILLKATEAIGKKLKKGDLVVFESTVYPGVTEEKCIPILEKASGLSCPADFGVGYSPERVNPGDAAHTFENITKLVSAIDTPTLDLIQRIYNTVVTVGTHRVSSIKVAEATKILENTQRDINIAFMNEAAMILHRCNMPISEVISAAKTKWNFIPYHPGLVGGHCIGVNSYYLAYKSMEAGYRPALIYAGLDVNKQMIDFLVQELKNSFNRLNISLKNAKVAILGITYKPDYSDFHDSKVMTLIEKIQALETNVVVHDPIANYEDIKKEYNFNLVKKEALKDLDAIILAVNHTQYRQLQATDLNAMTRSKAVIMDVMGTLPLSIQLPPEKYLWKM